MRNATPLGGRHKATTGNHPVSFVSIAIPSNPYFICDIDDDEESIYLNRATGVMQSVPADGFDLFTPYPGLVVPQISLTDQTIQDTLTISLAEQNGVWGQILASKSYVDAIVTVWQGQLDVSASDPESYAFANGNVTMYVGRMSNNLHVTPLLATLTVKPHVVPFTISIPYRMHDATTFKRLPQANKKLTWGYTERVV